MAIGFFEEISHVRDLGPIRELMFIFADQQTNLWIRNFFINTVFERDFEFSAPDGFELGTQKSISKCPNH